MIRKKKRTCYQKGAIGHICQRETTGCVVFYNVKDALVFLTISSVVGKRHRIRFLGKAIMHNHYHIDFTAENQGVLEAFIRDFCSWFARAYNAHNGMKGQRFIPYKVSNKKSDKAVRTALAYLNNNPVEEHLCSRAEEYRWNFLAYSRSDHPFSEKLELSKASMMMRRAVKKVQYFHDADRPLLYKQLDEMLDTLNAKEKKQLVDYIVKTYLAIDFELSISYYGSYEKMTDAFNNNTGSEYDIKEEYDPNSGRDYRTMSRYLINSKYHSIREVIHQDFKERIEYFHEITDNCKVSNGHARRFLHIRQAREEDFIQHCINQVRMASENGPSQSE